MIGIVMRAPNPGKRNLSRSPWQRYDQVAGIVAGACGNPAIRACANELTPAGRPDSAFAMIFPGTTRFAQEDCERNEPAL